MELLGEEVNTEVTVLTSLGGGGNADDLARAALKDQEITNADVVAGNSDSVEGSHLADRGTSRRWCGYGCDGSRALDADDLLDGSSGLDGAARRDGRDSRSVLLLDDYLFAGVVVLGSRVGVVVGVVVVVAVRVERMSDAISDLVGGFVDTLTEGVILAFVVVISHITFVLSRGVDGGTSSLFYSNLSWVAAVNGIDLTPVRVGIVLGSEGLLGVSCLGDDGTSAFTELTLSHVNLRRGVVGGRAVDSVEVSIVGPVLNLDVGGGRRVLITVAGNFELDAVSVLGAVGTLLWLSVASLLVDVDFLAVLGTAETLFLVDANLFFDVGVGVVGSLDGGREGCVGFFVTFPSVRSLFRDLCFAFYLDCGRFFNFHVPIRRREDTEGDRNSCFKIQFAGVGSLFLEYPSNRSKTIRKESRKNFLAPLGGSHLERCRGGRGY